MIFYCARYTEGIYEAIGDYKARNQDELTIKQGETFEVINRSMDGWWEIKYANCILCKKPFTLQSVSV